MSAKDKFHDTVKKALQKDGWVITDDPLYIPLERITGMYIDLAAEKLVAAEKDNRKIAVEDLPRRIEFATTQAKPASAGWKNPNIVLVHEGGLCLCSSELYSKRTFQTSSKLRCI
jgi:hypothetical protein